MNWVYHPDLLARAVPRYTSYPTAAEFRDGLGSEDMGAALDRVVAGTPISLYVHIPYCREICWYCGCNTGAANRTKRLDAYLARLEAEIALVAGRLGGRGRVSRIAFGGGSPNAIAPDQFVRLADTIRTAFAGDAATISVELDPRGFDQSWADALADVGVERASLGVQSFAPAVQAAIGRIQPAGDIIRAVRLLRAAGVGSINFDLMYGLPGQDDAALAASIEQTITLGADRIALFGYAHVPHMIPRQRRIDASALPDAGARFAQAASGYDMLTRAGYQPVGFDHFALPDDALARAARNGTLRRNFQGFTEDGAEILIGLGATAISAFPDRLLQNEKNNALYQLRIDAGRFPAARGIMRTIDDQERAAAIEALLCRGATPVPPHLMTPDLARQLAPFEDYGLVSWRDGALILSDAARPYARTIAAALDSYRVPDDRRFSRAV